MAKNEARERAMKDQRKRTDEDNAEATKRSNYKPTPTQEENDRAKLGVESLDELDNKEGDGAEEEEASQAPSRAAVDYQTRDAKADQAKK